MRRKQIIRKKAFPFYFGFILLAVVFFKISPVHTKWRRLGKAGVRHQTEAVAVSSERRLDRALACGLRMTLGASLPHLRACILCDFNNAHANFEWNAHDVNAAFSHASCNAELEASHALFAEHSQQSTTATTPPTTLTDCGPSDVSDNNIRNHRPVLACSGVMKFDAILPGLA